MLAPVVVALVLVAAPAQAQSGPQPAGRFLYGLSGGVGSQMTSGTFHSTALPPNAGQPASSQTIGVLDLGGGVAVTGRLALLGIFEQAGGSTTDTGRWGTLGIHGVMRV